MNTAGNVKRNTAVCLLFLLIVLQLLVCIAFGVQKKGFHEDEYYSYYSTCRTAGLYEPDREWQSAETVRNEFTVLPGEGFNYGLVALTQSWDVHPPFYYDLLHTVCSLFPGTFTKWTGIAVNLFAFVAAQILLYLLSCEAQEDRRLSLLICAVWGFHPMAVSFVMFIRMYETLSAFVIACALFHVRFLRRMEEGAEAGKTAGISRKVYFQTILPLMVCGYLGFLTQYYYVIFFFFAGLFTFLWLLKHGRAGAAAVYTVSCIACLSAAVLTFPASLSQILHGYRGTEAVSEFVSKTNLLQRLSFFLGLLNGSLYGGTFYAVAAVIVLSMILLRSKLNVQCRLLVFAAAGYFLVVAKTALILGATSNRYEMPVYGILILLTFTLISQLLSEYTAKREKGTGISAGTEKVRRAVLSILAACCAVLTVRGLLFSRDVLFLYPEESQWVDYADEHSSEPALVVYNSATPMNVWRLTKELLEYPKAYYMDSADTAPIEDETIKTADSLQVYMADSDDSQAQLKNILDSDPGLQGYEVISTKDMWTLYHFY
jgi:hypothetical protein